MKSLSLHKWCGSVLSPRTRPKIHLVQCSHQLYNFDPFVRYSSSAASESPSHIRTEELDIFSPPQKQPNLRSLPSPPPYLASTSARLAALHARLSLSPRLPLTTLARTLIDSSADPNSYYNNARLATLGRDILGYYTSEAILSRFPRLPTEVVHAATLAYCGPKTLAAITREWGVEAAAAPGGEVDAGLLQFQRQDAGNASVEGTGVQVKELPKEMRSRDLPATRRSSEDVQAWRSGGDTAVRGASSAPSAVNKTSPLEYVPKPTNLEAASARFVRALFGALYMHTGFPLTKLFYNAHILSRHLDFSALFSFREPTRDLAKLCARENFMPPVARMLSETGRLSRHPVFVVGVFAGREKLGEGSGGSLDEARIRAAVNALKAWYLYSPPEVKTPSQAKRGVEFEGVLVDGGEVVV